jgi:hypothetical protein
MTIRILTAALFPVAIACAQAQGVDPGRLAQLVTRLDQLERDNQSLRQEIDMLRKELSTLQESSEISQRRIEEQEQKKVGATQRFPVKLRGMLLANAFSAGSMNSGDTALLASRAAARRAAALTFRQSVIGLDFQGGTIWGAKTRGSVALDFYEGSTETQQFAPVRLRTADIRMDWSTTSLLFGQDKALIGLRDPASLAFVGISPLTSVGNLWRWMPQVRLEQRVGPTGTHVLLQGAVVQTNEASGGNPGNSPLEARRPGIEGRALFRHRFDEDRRIEIAPAFHRSKTHVGGSSVDTNITSIDWFANPWKKLELSGILWTGSNAHVFGAFRQGWILDAAGAAHAVKAKGGWAQASVPLTSRLTINTFVGTHDDRNRDLTSTGIGSNRAGGVNFFFRLAPNVITAFEVLQLRTNYLGSGVEKVNRYDLSVAYLF